MRTAFVQLLSDSARPSARLGVVALLGGLSAIFVSSCGSVDLGSQDSNVKNGDSGAAGLPGDKPDAPGVSGASCGSRGLSPCPEGSICYFAREAQCGDLDAPGTCRDYRAVDCLPDGTAVCGCDGKTYMNECIANVMGTSVRRDGPCTL